MPIHVERIGRRSYLRGDTYAIRDALRAAGAHWDADEKAWWIGSEAKAQELAAGAPAGESRKDEVTDDTRLLGKATYKGRSYLLLWEGQTKHGRAAKLAFTIGTKVVWAKEGEYQVTKRYAERTYRGRTEHFTFGDYRRLIERSKKERAESGGFRKVKYADPTALVCLECGTQFKAPGYVEQGRMGCAVCSGDD